MTVITLLCCLWAVFFIQVAIAAENGSTRHHRSANSNRSNNSPQDGYCERVYDRVMALSTLDEQQSRKLDGLDSRFTRMEVTNQERLDSMREELKEMTRRTQNLDWMSSKADGTLEQLRSEVEAMRQHMDMNTGQRQNQIVTPSPIAHNPNEEPPANISDMLASLAVFLTSVRQGVFNIERTFNILETNMTKLLQISREIQQRQHSHPSKQYLNNALHSQRSQPQFCALPHSNVNGGSSGTSSMPPSCAHIQLGDSILPPKSGVYKIQLNQMIGPFYVQCDMEEQDGGWTVILNRIDGSINFYRNWLEYKFGFGNIAGEFFIGLDKLHDMTSTMLHELLIVLEDLDGETRYAKYNAFAIGSEKEDYALNVLGSYDGTAEDAMIYSASHKFSTFDNDNDGWVEGNCAQSHTGGWWYNACEMANLNGQYLGGQVAPQNLFQGIYWNGFRGANYSLKSAKMLIRPIERIFNPDLS